MKNLFCLLFLAFSITVNAQVAINTDGSLPDNSAMLDVKSTEKGMLLPRMTLAQRNAITSPAAGLTIFQTDNIPGIYFNSGTSGSPLWVIAGTGSFWNLTGNAGTTAGTNFLGTTDGQPLMFKVNNQKAGYIDFASPFNTSFGYQSLNSSIYSYNSAFGYQALFSNTVGYENTASGYQALYSNTEGWENTANGLAALYSNTTGYRNTTNGYSALTNNTLGYSNTANGFMALYSNTIGYENTANGHGALYSNVAGNFGVAIGYNSQTYANNTGTPWDNTNTSIGYQSLMGSITPTDNTGNNNTAIGRDALYSNSLGFDNTATGMNALFFNTTGNYNTADGMNALTSNTTGAGNTAEGMSALSNNTIGSDNAATGRFALHRNTTASRNTAIGSNALYLQSYDPGSDWFSDNVAVGYKALYYNQPTSTGNGIKNTAEGNYALTNNTIGYSNTANGYDALSNNTTGAYNTAVGFNSGLAGNFNNTTSIGANAGYQGADNQVNIGNMSVSWIGGQVGWSTYSDERIKDNVTEDVPGLIFINKLRPVTYNLNLHKQNSMVYSGKKEEIDWPSKYDIEKIKMTGFIAQEVEQAANDVGYNFSGVQKPANESDLYSLRYSEFVVPLVKAVQEQQQQIEQLKSENIELKSENAAFEARLIAIESKLSGSK